MIDVAKKVLDGGRPRGRPPGTTRSMEPHCTASTWLAASDYDRLLRLARAHEVTVSDMMRRLIIFRLSDHAGD